MIGDLYTQGSFEQFKLFVEKISLTSNTIQGSSVVHVCHNDSNEQFSPICIRTK